MVWVLLLMLAGVLTVGHFTRGRHGTPPVPPGAMLPPTDLLFDEDNRDRTARISDPDLRIRLHAAMRLGEEGLPIIESLAVGRGLPDAVQYLAFRYLLDTIKEPIRREALLSQAFENATGSVVLLACRQLEALGKPRALSEIIDRMSSLDPDQLVPFAKYLKTRVTSDNEKQLMAILSDFEEVSHARCGAAFLLEEIGTASSVEALTHAKEDPDEELSSLAAQSLAAVMAREEAQGRGALTVSEASESEGQLEVVERGELTLED